MKVLKLLIIIIFLSISSFSNIKIEADTIIFKGIKRGIIINSNKWKSWKHSKHSNSQIMFRHKYKEISAFAIFERTRMSTETFRDVIIESINELFSNVKILNEKIINIKGDNYKCIEFNGNKNDSKGYCIIFYINDDNGILQLMAFTDKKFKNEHKEEMYSLFSGLIKITEYNIDKQSNSYLNNEEYDTFISMSDEEVQECLVEMCNIINKNCPRIVDKNITLTTTTVLPNRQLYYYYTRNDLLKKDVNSKIDYKAYREYSINFLKNTPSTEVFKILKVTVNYTYKDKNGNLLFNIKIKPEEY